MCGIAGYVGEKRPAQFLINILKKLEYRGYDSAGYSSLENGKIITKKQSGSIKMLEQSLIDSDEIVTAISHTRWATHGEPNELNAHPHVSKNQTWAIVHNGIIENYKELKLKLKHQPESQTDTSVASQLLEENKATTVFDFIDVMNKLEGSFAIVALNSACKNTLFLAKQKSPLYVAENKEHEFVVASDPICFCGFANEYYSFNDAEFAEISDKKVKFFDSNKNKIKKQKILMENLFEDSEKGNFSHFMIKEIMEEKSAILRQLECYKEKQILKIFDDWFLARFSEIKFIGCGTAYHAGLMGAKFVQKILNKKASAEMASEFIYNEPNFISNKTLYVFVSQSGETADTLRALELAKDSGATCVALTNVLYSTLAKKCEYVLPILAGVEIAVASTKAYVCMLTSIYLFCKYFKSQNEYRQAIESVENLANTILDFDKNKIEQIATNLISKKEAVFIGKDMDYITALESSLKLKEVSYINANAYPAGELKHGFLALVEKGTPLFVFVCEHKIKTKTMSSKSEAESRGAVSIIFENLFKNNNQNIDNNSQKIIVFEDDEMLAQIKIIAPMQYLAYRVSVLKKINPDQPRNLAKSVTVEWGWVESMRKTYSKQQNVEICK